MFSFGLVTNYLFTEVEHKRTMKGEIIFSKKSKYFSEIIDKCISDNPNARPKAQEVYDTLKAFDEYFWNSVEKHSYINLPTKEKNTIFDQLYDSYFS